MILSRYGAGLGHPSLLSALSNDLYTPNFHFKYFLQQKDGEVSYAAVRPGRFGGHQGTVVKAGEKYVEGYSGGSSLHCSRPPIQSIPFPHPKIGPPRPMLAPGVISQHGRDSCTQSRPPARQNSTGPAHLFVVDGRAGNSNVDARNWNLSWKKKSHGRGVDLVKGAFPPAAWPRDGTWSRFLSENARKDDTSPPHPPSF